MKKVHIIFWVFLSVNVFAEEPVKEKNYKLEFTGFLKYYMMFDTRQTINAREGNFMMYPEAPLYDKENRDINAESNFNMSTISSMLKFRLHGPEVFNARSQAYLELDFWGSETRKNVDLNHFRLRHAYVHLNWGKTELIVGQYWHPMSVAGFFPKIASSNSGVPFHPISRNPQIRIKQDIGLLKLIGCLFTQRDFTSTGPDGADSKYLRNSGIPNLHLQFQAGDLASKITGGAGIDYKRIVPELYIETSEGMVKTGKKNTLSSFSYVGFLKLRNKFFTMNTQGIYSANAHDIILIGGYAEKEIINAETGLKKFSNLRTLSLWSDFLTTGERIRFGLFGGYTQNLGAGETVTGPIYARGANIKNVYRVSSRIIYIKKPFEISVEGEHTTTGYGMANGDNKGGVTDISPVSNLRLLSSVKYYF